MSVVGISHPAKPTTIRSLSWVARATASRRAAMERSFSWVNLLNTDALAEKAILLVSKHLVRAYRDGGDIVARTAVADGSLLAGMALANARLGAVHGLAHPIGGMSGREHGVICGALMGVVLQFNRRALASDGCDKYERLGELLGGEPVEYINDLLGELGLPGDLRGCGIDGSAVGQLAVEAAASSLMTTNPRDVTVDDCAAMIQAVI